MDDSDSTPRRAERPERVLSEEQKMMLALRAKANSRNNKERLRDTAMLKQHRQSNRDSSDLMLALYRTVDSDFSLSTVGRLHETLVVNGVENPARYIDEDAVRIACEMNGDIKTGYGFGYSGARPVKFSPALVFVLTSGEDRDLVFSIIKERQIEDVDEIKQLLAEMKRVHRSLSEGSL